MDTVKTLLYVVWTVALFAAGYLLFKNFRTIKETLEKPNALNPVSRDNIVYSGINNVLGTITDTSDFSIGSSLYNLTHVDEFKSTFVDKPARPSMPRDEAYYSEGWSAPYVNPDAARIADYWGEGDTFPAVTGRAIKH